MSREATNKLIELIDEQLIDPYEVAIMCLKWMSEDDVARMCEENDVFWILEEDEEDEEDAQDAYDQDEETNRDSYLTSLF